MKVRQIIAAEVDASTLALDLERMRSGWGTDFKEELRTAITTVESNPRLQPRTEDGPDEPENREYYITRFEIRVIYEFWKNELVLVAVIHAKQKRVVGFLD